MITFIIPSVGRQSLWNSLHSIKNQTKPDWKAYIVFDGVPIPEIPDEFKDDERFTFDTISKRGVNKNGNTHGCAGLVRNYMLEKTDTWIGFLDDDDVISPHYVDSFEKEIAETPDTKLIIFRMKIGGTHYPPLGVGNFKINRVGISFAVHPDVWKEHGIYFKQCTAEDFYYLDASRAKGLKIVISGYVIYYVNSLNPPQNLEHHTNSRRVIN